MKLKIVKTLDDIKDNELAITIGNFDGVHLGHKFVIENIKNKLTKNQKLVLITFTPHPSEVLSPRQNFLLNNHNEKIEMLESLGVDYLFVVEFTRDLSTLTGSQFLNKYLSSDIKNVCFYLGYDFSFGANKKDGVNIIEEFCKKQKYEYKVLERCFESDMSISSSRVREEIIEGNIQSANKYLGRDFYITGTIVKGEGRGRQIGFPTANLQYQKERIVPGKGVYSTSVLYKGGKYKSVTNIGVKPTFEENAELTVETNLLDFDKDIYGESFELFFHKKIRDEVKFDSVNDLITQIKKDIATRKKSA